MDKFYKKDHEAKKEEKKERERLTGEFEGDDAARFEAIIRDIERMKEEITREDDEAEEAREDAECAYVNTRHPWHKDDIDENT